jgi:hypothetical protein
MKKLLLLTFLFGALANTIYACDLPVCDIPGTIARLEKVPLDERSNFLRDLYNKYRLSAKPEALQNLHDFSIQSGKLQKHVGDPENVVAWSIYIRETSIYGLLKHAPFNLELMKSLYDESFKIPELNIERQMRIRFDSYQRWRAQINSIMDTDLVYSLYAFLDFAKQQSEEFQDDDYLIREANSVLEIAGRRLSYLYPNYEGVYDIKATCSPTPADCGNVDLKEDKLVFMHSTYDIGIYSALYSQTYKTLSYMFNRTAIESFGTKLYSLSDIANPLGRPSEIYANLTRDQKVKGYVISSRFSGTLHFEGKIIYSPIAFYVDEGTKGKNPIVPGKYKGKMGDKEVSMIIRVKKGKSLMATLWVDEPSGFLIDFSNGEFIEHRGIVNLVGMTPQKAEPYKINLAYRENPETNEYRWIGGFFTTSGKFESLELKKVSEIDIPTEQVVINKDLL